MTQKKTIKGRYRYTGIPDGFYHTGEVYYLTIEYRRRLWRKYMHVSCRRGGYDDPYAGCMPIVYGGESAFKQDWSRV